MNISFSNLWNKLRDKGYRHSFARRQFKRLVPFQIQALRKQRGWSQETLASNANLTQGVISRAEDPDYGNLTVNTILKIADGFDCVFVGRFVPYSEFARWYVGLSEELIPIPTFTAEDEFRAAIENPRLEGIRELIRPVEESRLFISATTKALTRYDEEFDSALSKAVSRAAHNSQQSVKLPLMPMKNEQMERQQHVA